MAKRNEKALEIARLFVKYQQDTLTKDDLYELILKRLEKSQRKAYELIKQGSNTSVKLAESMKISIGHAGTILISLRRLGLIRRTLIRDKQGRHYEYEVV